ncbi:MAG: YihA family ribosome biogenesis GTP-binding protein [Tissierellia bacterium]|nr:YihA family ribosome biogenesis GTP-binding protein [Tissierellia bacterium]
MIIRKVELEKVAANKKQYPNEDLPEIAFAGRSNVGKSSFINSLVNRKSLARTSGKPGKTRTINFYNVNDEFRLVDLPGYGYAQVSKEEKKKWGHIIEEYLNTRENLVEVVQLVDIRHSPTEEDLMMHNWIRAYGYRGLVVATKGDKINKNKYPAQTKAIKNKLEIEDSSLIIPYSSLNKMNIDIIWDEFYDILGIEKEQ